jgi:phosphate transport system substrate-binding protein
MHERESNGGTSRRKFLTATGAGLGALALAGCTQQGGDGGDGGSGGGNGGDGDGGGDEGLSGEINIAGSSTVFPLATQMKEEFQAEHPEVSINIQSTGSGGGFQNFFCVGDSDFNNASRPIRSEEEELCAENGVTPIELRVATDALTVVVNNDAEFISDVTVEELQQIWSEDGAQSWSDVREEWPDEEINRFGPTEASGTYDYFIEAIIGEEGERQHTTDLQATENDRTIVQGVQNNEYAIGYMGFAYYSNNQDTVKALAVDGVEPSLETAKSGEYTPLSRPLFTYPAKERLAEAHIAEFARFFIRSSTSTEIVAEKVGYVPNSQEEADAQLEALESAIEEVG